MPGRECDAITDLKERADCKAYRGKYAKPSKEMKNIQRKILDRARNLRGRSLEEYGEKRSRERSFENEEETSRYQRL